MLISTAELAAQLGDSNVVIFDCRNDLVNHGKGAQLYAESHLPGAQFASVETALAGEKNGRNGRHPLPDPTAFVAFLAQCGVSPQSKVIAYDDAGGLYAARLWWLARWVGLTNVSLLDGGWNKWVAEKRVVTNEVPTPRAAKPWSVHVDSTAVLTSDDVSRRLNNPSFALIDARAGERYRGEVEPMDPVAGHIPGAVNRFYKTNLRSDLTFRDAPELKQDFLWLLGDVPPSQVGHQCGSGITACANLFAMEYAGLKGSKLYAGSWSEWVADSARPVVRGTKA